MGFSSGSWRCRFRRAETYVTLQAGKAGVILLGEGAAAANPTSGGGMLRSVWRFTLEDPQQGGRDACCTNAGEIADIVYNRRNGAVSERAGVVYREGDRPDSRRRRMGTRSKGLNLGGMQAKVDPRAQEWKQMFAETWRIEREFFYDPGFHGLNLKKIEGEVFALSRRAEFAKRSDLSTGRDAGARITVGHMFINGPRGGNDGPKGGLLGADYAIDHDRYRVCAHREWRQLESAAVLAADATGSECA